MNQNKNYGPVNDWVAINKELRAYKMISMGLVAANLLLGGILVITLNQDPIVLTLGSNHVRMLSAERKTVEITKEEVEEFIAEFIWARYVFQGKNLENVRKQVAPLATDGYLDAFKKQMERDFSGPKQLIDFSQSVANIAAVVTEKETIAKFDKIIRLGGVPLLIPTEVSLQIVRGRPNKWNPRGLFVHGVIEHEIK